jgi:DNA-binding transcriptional MerR regulator
MTKNKAYQVIKTFNPAEMKAFELFLRSPYYNSNKTIVKLFELLKKHIQKSPAKDLNEEEVFVKLYPGKKYNYGIMKNLVSELFRQCEKFLAVHPGEDEAAIEFEEGLRRLKNYNNRSLDKLFHAEYKKLGDKMEYSVLSTNIYRSKFRLVEAFYKYYVRRSKYTGAADTLYPMSIYNTCDIISTIKQDIAGMEYLESQLNTVPPVDVTAALYRNFDFENFLKEIKGLDAEYFEYINLQVRLMKLYREPGNVENYTELKQFVFAGIDNYSNSERWFLSSALFNFVLARYITGSSNELLLELAAIRKMQLKHVKFNSGGLGPLQAGVFRNIIEVFVMLRDTGFALEIIEKYLNELEADSRKSIFSYSMALIEESRGNYEKALKLLSDVEFTDYQAKFSAKMLAMVIFYNLGFIEEGLSAIDSMKHLVRDTTEFSEAVKANLNARVTTLEKLFKIKANPEKYSVSDVLTLEESAAVYLAARKDWFLSKTAELKQIVENSL